MLLVCVLVLGRRCGGGGEMVRRLLLLLKPCLVVPVSLVLWVVRLNVGLYKWRLHLGRLLVLLKVGLMWRGHFLKLLLLLLVIDLTLISFVVGR